MQPSLSTIVDDRIDDFHRSRSDVVRLGIRREYSEAGGGSGQWGQWYIHVVDVGGDACDGVIGDESKEGSRFGLMLWAEQSEESLAVARSRRPFGHAVFRQGKPGGPRMVLRANDILQDSTQRINVVGRLDRCASQSFRG